jgi:hypothetical protein
MIRRHKSRVAGGSSERRGKSFVHRENAVHSALFRRLSGLIRLR